jgi:ribonuclease HI
VKDNKILHKDSGTILGSGGADVERAESEALMRAVSYCKKHPGNYEVRTDSKSMIDKLKGNVSNATGNPHVNGIRRILQEIKQSPLPHSIELKFVSRRSDEWMILVDDMCEILT